MCLLIYRRYRWSSVIWRSSASNFLFLVMFCMVRMYMYDGHIHDCDIERDRVRVGNLIQLQGYTYKQANQACEM